VASMVDDYERFTKLFDGIEAEIDAAIKQLGFDPAPAIKMFNGRIQELPERISELTNRENSDLQGAYVSVYAYATRMLSRAEIKEIKAERKYRRMRHRVYLSATGTGEERKAKAATDNRCLDLEEAWIKWVGIAKDLRAICEGLERARGVLSRDVEYRKREMDQHQRAHNVALGRGTHVPRGKHD